MKNRIPTHRRGELIIIKSKFQRTNPFSQKDVKFGIDKELIEKIGEERDYGRDIIVTKDID